MTQPIDLTAEQAAEAQEQIELEFTSLLHWLTMAFHNHDVAGDPRDMHRRIHMVMDKIKVQTDVLATVTAQSASRIAGLEADNKRLRGMIESREQLKAYGIDLDKTAVEVAQKYLAENAALKVEVERLRSRHDILAKGVTAVSATRDKFMNALHAVKSIDDDGFTSDGHERCVEIAKAALTGGNDAPN